ncbi:major tail protein [Eggerthella guodeyinii]|uniref:Phage tail protein n=1 Tax=Eggerthella guodeyinii TaxID=2690837 RepID=A0A6N7RLX4_9ACTN|nr:major tail protein [Eggerthella guodeyinii]MRX82256.1 hypothetical protein [Eggerthella guodeyinii]
MPRNGFFGVKNAHFAPMTDEDALTYDTPVPVAGTVEIKMEPSVESASSFADNEVWLDKQQDNGGSGTMSFYDVEGTPELRALIAKLVGYQIAQDGRTILSADVTPVPFGFMCEQPGHITGKRRCLYKCQLSKPSLDAKSTEEKPDITQLDYDFSWRVVKLPSGVRTSGYDSYTGLADYENFFDKIDTALTLKTDAAPTEGAE